MKTYINLFEGIGPDQVATDLARFQICIIIFIIETSMPTSIMCMYCIITRRFPWEKREIYFVFMLYSQIFTFSVMQERFLS